MKSKLTRQDTATVHTVLVQRGLQLARRRDKKGHYDLNTAVWSREYIEEARRSRHLLLREIGLSSHKSRVEFRLHSSAPWIQVQAPAPRYDQPESVLWKTGSQVLQPLPCNDTLGNFCSLILSDHNSG